MYLLIRFYITGQEVRNIIESTAQKLLNYTYTPNANQPNGTWNNEVGHGLVDAFEAVKAACAPLVVSQGQLQLNFFPTTFSNCKIECNGIIVTGKSVEFNHIESIELKGGFEVQLGGSLEVKTQP